LEIEFSFNIPILPVLRVQTHIRSVRGSNPCTATNKFNKLASKIHVAGVVQIIFTKSQKIPILL
jgi:hypothetical protein